MVHVDAGEVRALTRDLQNVRGHVGATVSAAIRKTARDIESDAKAIALAKNIIDTGDLINSISTEITGDGRTGSMEAEIGPTVEYGIYQELGTSDQEPRPFMGPAFDRRAPGLDAVLLSVADGLA